jgi:hypothetical protein
MEIGIVVEKITVVPNFQVFTAYFRIAAARGAGEHCCQVAVDKYVQSSRIF